MMVFSDDGVPEGVAKNIAPEESIDAQIISGKPAADEMREFIEKVQPISLERFLQTGGFQSFQSRGVRKFVKKYGAPFYAIKIEIPEFDIQIRKDYSLISKWLQGVNDFPQRWIETKRRDGEDEFVYIPEDIGLRHPIVQIFDYLSTNGLGGTYYFDKDAINLVPERDSSLLTDYNIANVGGSTAYVANLVDKTLSDAFSAD